MPLALIRSKNVSAVVEVLWLCSMYLTSGCSTPSVQQQFSGEVALKQQVCLLAASVSTNEAQTIATTAYKYSLELRKQYCVVPPALFHNFLVNIGIRKRGLCYQWADDLSAKLNTLGLQTIEVHRAIARPNSLRVHCAVVLTARHQSFDQGLVLDAWRHSGYLYWGPVKKDKYPWIFADGLFSAGDYTHKLFNYTNSPLCGGYPHGRIFTVSTE